MMSPSHDLVWPEKHKLRSADPPLLQALADHYHLPQRDLDWDHMISGALVHSALAWPIHASTNISTNTMATRSMYNLLKM